MPVLIVNLLNSYTVLEVMLLQNFTETGLIHITAEPVCFSFFFWTVLAQSIILKIGNLTNIIPNTKISLCSFLPLYCCIPEYA